jgi:hypothetical protein
MGCGVSELALPKVYAQHAGTCDGCRQLTNSCMKDDLDDQTKEMLALKNKSPLPLNKSSNQTSATPVKPLKFTVKGVVALKKRVSMLQFQVVFLAALHLWS